MRWFLHLSAAGIILIRQKRELRKRTKVAGDVQFAESFFENSGVDPDGSKKAEQIAYHLREQGICESPCNKSPGPTGPPSLLKRAGGRTKWSNKHVGKV